MNFKPESKSSKATPSVSKTKVTTIHEMFLSKSFAVILICIFSNIFTFTEFLR